MRLVSDPIIPPLAHLPRLLPKRGAGDGDGGAGSDVAADHAHRGGQMTLPVTSAIATDMGKRRARVRTRR